MRNKGFSSIIFILVILFAIIFLGIAFYNYNNDSNTKNIKNENTDYLITKNETALVKENNKQLNESEWKEYSGSEFDISFQYPYNWEVVVGYAQEGTFDFECNYITDFLKEPDICTGLYKSPEVVIKPANSSEKGLILWGPTSGLGGGCPECELDNVEVTVNNSKYIVPVKIAPVESNRDKFSTFPDGGVYINETGKTSIWSKMDLEFSTSDKETYDTILKIVETIKPN